MKTQLEPIETNSATIIRKYKTEFVYSDLSLCQDTFPAHKRISLKPGKPNQKVNFRVSPQRILPKREIAEDSISKARKSNLRHSEDFKSKTKERTQSYAGRSLENGKASPLRSGGPQKHEKKYSMQGTPVISRRSIELPSLSKSSPKKSRDNALINNGANQKFENSLTSDIVNEKMKAACAHEVKIDLNRVLKKHGVDRMKYSPVRQSIKGKNNI